MNWSDVTASLDPATRADAVKRIADPAKAAGLVSTGFMEAITSAQAIANNKGLFAYNRSTSSVLTTTVRTSDGTGSGWAGATHHDWSSIDPSALGARATQKGAQVSINPVAIEPGRYTVVFEPTAVGNLVQFITRAFNARAADEGRSFFSLARRQEQDWPESRRRARDDHVRSVRSERRRLAVHVVTDRRRNASCGSRTAS